MICQQELPSAHELELARRRHLAAQRNQAAPGADNAAAWVEKIKQETAERDAKQPHQFRWHELQWDAPWLPLHQIARAEAERRPAEGSCMLMSDTMLNATRCLLEHLNQDHQPVILQTDFTWKISREKWAVAVIGFCCKHIERSSGLPASGFVCAALGWGPKESEATWSCLFITFLECLRRRLGFPMELLVGVLFDGAAGGKAALRAILPRKVRLKDLRHVQVAVERLPLTTCGQARYRTYLAGEIQFLALTYFRPRTKNANE